MTWIGTSAWQFSFLILLSKVYHELKSLRILPFSPVTTLASCTFKDAGSRHKTKDLTTAQLAHELHVWITSLCISSPSDRSSGLAHALDLCYSRWTLSLCHPSLIKGATRNSWRRKEQLTPAFLPRESHGQRSVAGCSPWGHRELDMN